MHILNEEAFLRGCGNAGAQCSKCLLTRCNNLIIMRKPGWKRSHTAVSITQGKKAKTKLAENGRSFSFFFFFLIGYVRLIHWQVAHYARNLYLNQVLETHANKLCRQPSRWTLKIGKDSFTEYWKVPYCAYFSGLYSIVIFRGAVELSTKHHI